jgi:DNA-binding winged helix-turn-helix (wHTH) protein
MTLRFGDCEFDAERRRLRRDGRDVHLPHKAFELLRLLVDSRPRALSKAELHDHLWPATFVSDDSLARLVTQIRTAIGDDAREGRFLRTMRGFGYAFSEIPSDEPGATPPATGLGPKHWIVVDGREVRLAAGENIIGRDADVRIWLAASGVSRRHARVVVDDTTVMLDDLGSKNGTYHEGRRLVAPVRLTHGDRIRIGSFDLAFRTTSTVARETETARSDQVPSRKRTR